MLTLITNSKCLKKTAQKYGKAILKEKRLAFKNYYVVSNCQFDFLILYYLIHQHL